jgi:hypothetical protein
VTFQHHCIFILSVTFSEAVLHSASVGLYAV